MEVSVSPRYMTRADLDHSLRQYVDSNDGLLVGENTKRKFSYEDCRKLLDQLDGSYKTFAEFGSCFEVEEVTAESYASELMQMMEEAGFVDSISLPGKILETKRTRDDHYFLTDRESIRESDPKGFDLEPEFRGRAPFRDSGVYFESVERLPNLEPDRLWI